MGRRGSELGDDSGWEARAGSVRAYRGRKFGFILSVIGVFELVGVWCCNRSFSL